MKLLGRTFLMATLLAAAPAAALLSTASASAQADTARSLTGTVTDKDGNKVKGAVVHLKDTRSLAQRSYITPDDGTFRFAQLSGSTDYEVWADLNGNKSASKSISSFDNKKAVDMTLKLPN